MLFCKLDGTGLRGTVLGGHKPVRRCVNLGRALDAVGEAPTVELGAKRGKGEMRILQCVGAPALICVFCGPLKTVAPNHAFGSFLL
jgi:hypothetical protein